MNKRELLTCATSLLLGTTITRTSWADSPAQRPLRIVVPQPAGLGPDVLARTLADQLSKLLGVSVIVDNKPGANGTVAASAVLGLPADGNTVFLAGVSNLAWNPYLYANIGYNPSRDFKGVAAIANSGFVTVVSPKLGVTSFADLLTKVRNTAPPMSYASAGVGNSTHLAMELIAERTGMKLQHIPFNGAGAYTSLMAGDTPLMTTVPGGTLDIIRSGKLVALAVTGEKRMEALPQVPTYKELGYDISVPGWYALVTRSGTPEAAITRLNTAINQAIDSPEMQARLAGQVLQPMKGPASEVERLMQRDSEAWGPFIKKLNLSTT